MHCHAGCATADIVSSLGFTMADLMPPRQPAQRATITAIYDYVDADGNLLYQVCRMNPKSFRQRRPDPDKRGGWLWNLNGTARVLYNLPAVLAAQRAGKKVFLVEGEKDADNLAKLGLTATTNAGGAQKWLPAYTDVLRAGPVIILPDNDEPGRKHAAIVRRALPDSVILELPGLGPKQDVSDWIAAGGTREDLIRLARAALDAPPATPPAPPEPDAPFKPLGYSRDDLFYFLVSATQTVARVSSTSLSRKTAFLRLAPLDYWESVFESQYTLAANALMRQCESAGLFDPMRIRGRGAWWDDGRTVLHQGDRLVVDGKPAGLLDAGGRYVYERAPRLNIPHTEPRPAEPAVYELCQLCPWANPNAAMLLAGWIAIAPICGVLRWRPHIWVTGPAGSGKSWILDNIVGALLGDMALKVQSVTTEAGLRQMLGTDARPVLFDEAELEDSKSQMNMQRVLELARQASSESGAVILKGTVHGDAMAFHIRSCFLLSSIGVGVRRRADETRVTVLSLVKPLLASSAQREAATKRFADLQERTSRTCTTEFAASLIARSCGMARTIRKNAETFAVACARVLDSRRTGDQLGALLAGYYSLWSDGEIALNDAMEFVREREFAELTPTEETQDETRCLTYLLEQQIEVELERGRARRAIGELVESITAPIAGDVPRSVAESVLGRHGIRVQDDGLAISVSHSAIGNLLKNTPWAVGWTTFLQRIEGAKAGRDVHPIRFPGGVRARVVIIPWAAIEGGESVQSFQDAEEGLPF